jgi:hypothetical protein
MVEDLYLDKIRLGAVLVDKEFSIVNLYANVINLLRSGSYDKEHLDEINEYNWAWLNITELYSLLHYDKYYNVLNKEQQKHFTSIIERYTDFKPLGLDDLKACVDYVNILMSKNNFHDVFRETDDNDY